MIGFRHVESGAIHFAETADGYGEPEWAALGPLPEGVPTDLVLWSDDAGSFVEDLATARSRRWAYIKDCRDAAEWAGAPTPHGLFDSDPASQTKLNGAITAAQLAIASGDPFAIEWTCADNSTVTLDAAQMVDVGLAVLAHVNAVHQQGRTLREQIEAAATIAAIDAINWPS